MVVRMNCRKGGMDGIYHCKIPDATKVSRSSTLECTTQALVSDIIMHSYCIVSVLTRQLI